MPYSESLSGQNPGYIVILIDQSGSMSDRFGGGSKAEECAKAVNRVLKELGKACTSGTEVKNRCEISILSYGKSGNSIVNGFSGNLASQAVVTMPELVANCLRVDKVKRKMSDGAGGLVELDDDFPIWVEPAAIGGTPMAEAFQEAYNLVSNWTQSHKSSFPPVVINITDGEPNDESQAKTAALQLSQTGTDDGNTLILNAHISTKMGGKVELPSSANGLPDSNAQFLFNISSELPPVMLDGARAVGFEPSNGARGFVYNADAEVMIRLLDIGTKPKLR
jgi:uncharacterized protein YegL